MKIRLIILSTVVSAVAITAGSAIVSAQKADLARGKYLVEEVARCQECHTPKKDDGTFDTSKWLKGGMLTVKPVTEIKGWHAAAPNITSTSAIWQRWGQDGMVKFLETATNPRGGKAGAPMPAYTMSHEDAVAVAAYLKSLP
jgi:mono/diheme cytochrome c family protein